MKVLIVLLSVLSLVELSEFEKCGQTKFSAGLIVHGKKVSRGEFPFMCALHDIETNQVFCGGTLVTSKHVITAAHCMKNKDQEVPLDPRDLLVLLGAHNLKSRYESGALQEKVIDITIHPQWKIKRNDYDSDIAVIILKNQIVFSMYIRPACFPAEDDMKFNTNQTVGTVVGWGATNSSLTIQAKPAKAIVTTRTNEYCFLHKPDILVLSSLQTFCAIGENAGPCSGDSGGGFFEKIDQSWTIRGIISATTLINSQCDLSQYAVYTNIGMFYDWIKETIARTGCPGVWQGRCLLQNVRQPQQSKYLGEFDSEQIDEIPERDNIVQVDENIEPSTLLTSTTTTAALQSNYGPRFTNLNALNRLVAKPSGNTIKIRCPAKGDPEPTIEWTKNGAPIERKMGQVRANKWAITLEDLIPDDSGAYTCTICNIHSCINFTTKVEVVAPVISEGHPRNLTVLENSTAEFKCPILSDLGWHIEWAKFYSLNATITAIPKNVPKLERDDENAEVLRLENVTFSDEGWYTCLASNSLGSASASAYLQVVEISKYERGQ